MRFGTLVILLLLPAVGGALAKEQAADEGFMFIDANICRFKLKGYEPSEAIREAITFGVTLIIETYREKFGFDYPDDFVVNITVINDQQQFFDYQRKQLGKVVSEVGYYNPEESEVVVCKCGQRREFINSIYHEASHLILMEHISWCPVWVNEGLAEYFAGLRVIGSNKRIFLKKTQSDWCKYWLKNGFPIELEKYVSLSYDEWIQFREKDINAAYTIGYSLVYFMMSRHKTQEVLKELLWDFKEHGKDANSLKTIDEHYPGGFKKFERIWKRWIPRAKPYRPLRTLRKKADKKVRSSAK